MMKVLDAGDEEALAAGLLARFAEASPTGVFDPADMDIVVAYDCDDRYEFVVQVRGHLLEGVVTIPQLILRPMRV